MRQKVVGLLGGMGPESTADLLVKIVRKTPVDREQDHLRIIIDSNPKVPDRTEALLSGNTLPVTQALCETALNLERAGAEIIGIPCNTAHAFLAAIRGTVGVPVLDMVNETSKRAMQLWGKETGVGILATNGTLATGLYHEALAQYDLIGIAPATDALQQSVMEALNAVKLHGVVEESQRILGAAIQDLQAQGANALIAGCTEVSLVLARYPPDLPWLDPLQVLAEALIREATTETTGGEQ